MELHRSIIFIHPCDKIPGRCQRRYKRWKKMWWASLLIVGRPSRGCDCTIKHLHSSIHSGSVTAATSVLSFTVSHTHLYRGPKNTFCHLPLVASVHADSCCFIRSGFETSVPGPLKQKRFNFVCGSCSTEQLRLKNSSETSLSRNSAPVNLKKNSTLKFLWSIYFILTMEQMSGRTWKVSHEMADRHF